ncbi:MAG: thrombospondin type-1 domain-containing protein [Gammaproteobacteria bacterium]|nr:thrombospondin type-1 domain-containing protein [Gammaproteobacteria bacterium]
MYIIIGLKHYISVNGGWSDWSEWGACDSECIGGNQERSRMCDNPPVAGTGTDCQGEATETQECNANIVCPGKTTLTMSPLSVAKL